MRFFSASSPQVKQIFHNFFLPSVLTVSRRRHQQSSTICVDEMDLILALPAADSLLFLLLLLPNENLEHLFSFAYMYSTIRLSSHTKVIFASSD